MAKEKTDSDLNRVIERAKQELEQMIDFTPDVMLLLDTEGTILRANRAVLTLLGSTRFHDVIRRPLQEVFHLDATAVRKLIDCKKPRTESVLQAEIGGRTRPLRFAVMPAAHAAGWCVAFVEDVEEENRRTETMEQQFRREATRTLVCTLMHNINQPLTVILITAQLVKLNLERQDASVEDMKKHLQSIIKHTLQIGGMLKRLEEPSGYQTEKYVGSVNMLDVRGSAVAGLKKRAISGTGPDVLARLMEVHVPGYLKHANRTAHISEILAKKLGLSDGECATAMSCGYYHDIGKMGIPDAILCKSTELDAAEMTTMRSHSKTGHDFLSQFPFVEEEAAVAWCHHERMDGSGYPRGLAGKDLSIFTQVVIVADCYEVIRSGRPYQPARSRDETMAEMRKGSGIQFPKPVIEVLAAHVADIDDMFI